MELFCAALHRTWSRHHRRQEENAVDYSRQVIVHLFRMHVAVTSLYSGITYACLYFPLIGVRTAVAVNNPGALLFWPMTLFPHIIAHRSHLFFSFFCLEVLPLCIRMLCDWGQSTIEIGNWWFVMATLRSTWQPGGEVKTKNNQI